MTLTRDQLYTYVQKLFQRGLVLVVGSGVSCAQGLPGMGALATHLLTRVPGQVAPLCDSANDEWNQICAALVLGTDLETALGLTPPSEPLADVITAEVASCVASAESVAVSEILRAPEVPPFGRLLQHMLGIGEPSTVITTNYDRLIEVHAARAGVRIDSMFYGHTVGRLNAALSRDELWEVRAAAGRRPSGLAPTIRPHIRLAKPHGSLDWFEQNGEYFRSDLLIRGNRQVIAPGGNKYRMGYEVPFDSQRQRANDALDSAASLLLVGYGFNDEHLQTHLQPRFQQVPAVVAARSLTANARSYLVDSPNAVGIEENSTGTGCVVVQGANSLELDQPLWDVDYLAKEVLGL